MIGSKLKFELNQDLKDLGSNILEFATITNVKKKYSCKQTALKLAVLKKVPLVS